MGLLNISNYFENAKLSKKLISAFLLVSLVPMGIIISLALYESSSAMKKQVYDQLDAVSEIKRSAVNRHFEGLQQKLHALAMNPYVASAAHDFSAAFNEVAEFEGANLLNDFYQQTFFSRYKEQNPSSSLPTLSASQLSNEAIALQTRYIANNPNELGQKHLLMESPLGDSYDLAHSAYHDYFKELANTYHFYDIFIIDNASANIVYTVFKEVDFATNLRTGPFANSPLAKIFVKAQALSNNRQFVFEDYTRYTPSYEAPASFVAAPIAINGEVSATLVIQLSIDALNAIMTERQGLGETGETYLIGPDGLMRSDSYLDPVDHSVVGAFKHPERNTIKTQAFTLSQQGQSGNQIILDYNGNPVLSSFKPVDVMGTRWSLLAEMDEAEAFAAVNQLTYIMIGVLLLSGAAIIVIATLFAKRLVAPVHELVNTMKNVEAQGDFSLRANVLSQDEIGSSAMAFNGLLDALQSSISEANTVMNHLAKGEFGHRITGECNGELALLKDATNHCAASLEEAMQEINQVMISMTAGQFDNPIHSHLEGDLGKLKNNINNTLNTLSATIGNIVEVMADLEQGQFDSRVEVAAQGQFAQLKSSVNNSVLSLSSAVNEVARVMAAIRQGDFNQHVELELKGQLNTLKLDINSSVQGLSEILSDISTVMSAVSAGDFKREVTCEADGELLTLKKNINQSIRSLDKALSEVSSVMMAISHGRFDRQIQTPMNGQLDSLKQDINRSVNALDTVMEELASVMAAMREGNFGVSIGSDFQGQLAAMKDDVNAATKDISRAMSEVQRTLSALAKGDLTKQVDGQFKGVFKTVQTDMNQTIRKLTDVIGEIQTASELVSQSAEEIAQSNTEISRRTEEQAANLEEASASTGHMLDEISEVANQSTGAVNLAENARTIAEEGGQLSFDTVTAINDVNAASKDINEIVSVIDGLAFQTNLLALNAAVEAARAGEHGRGFAVVANEVRELAGRSASSAKQIKTIIANSNQKVTLGTDKAHQSGEKLEQIVNAVTTVNQSIIKISQSTQTQQQSIKEVDIVVQRLSAIVQENSAVTEETMAAARQMSEQAFEMKKQLSYFRLASNAKADLPSESSSQSDERLEYLRMNA
ncbi:putative methyl-accepting chemotaxis protein [Pseudoalteromonas luteoviolacea B = ATCC 29581]|nr:putative methyl-accepting chemotaxis protein [Pseudoalteromonas luteoviolacea B = ATCC 29581]